MNLFPQFGMRYGLAAQPDNHHTIDIGIQGKARQDFLAHFRIGRYVTATGIKDDIYRAPHLTGHNPAGLTAAGTGRKNQYMIADTGTAFLAPITIKLHITAPPSPAGTHWRNLWARCGCFHGKPNRPAEYPAKPPQ